MAATTGRLEAVASRLGEFAATIVFQPIRLGAIAARSFSQRGAELMSDAQSSWRQAADHFKALGSRLQETYRQTAGDSVGEATQRVGDAMDRLAQAVREAITDEQLRREASSAIETTLNAIGETFERLGDRMFQRSEEEPTAGDRTGTGEQPAGWGEGSPQAQPGEWPHVEQQGEQQQGAQPGEWPHVEQEGEQPPDEQEGRQPGGGW